MESKEKREAGLHGFKRQQILNAAKSLFAAKGLDGTTMRAIATEAGYSVGAAYSYYQSKDDIFAALLADSLSDLGRYIKMSVRKNGYPEEIITGAFIAFHRFFSDRPEERRLCLTLFGAASSAIEGNSAEKALSSKLLGVLGYLATILHEQSSFSAAKAQNETIDAVTYMTGVLLLGSSGHLTAMGQREEEMIDRYMKEMLLRTRT